MPRNIEGCITVSTDLSEEAAALGGRNILDFSGVRHDPHDINAGKIAFIINNARDSEGHIGPKPYRVRLVGPNTVTVSPPLSDAAKDALKVCFDAEVVDVLSPLRAVS
jgi:hypothetical protein